LDGVPKGDFAKDAQEVPVQVQEPLGEEFEALVEEQEALVEEQEELQEVLAVLKHLVEELAVHIHLQKSVIEL
jgi:hypothetical protein